LLENAGTNETLAALAVPTVYREKISTSRKASRYGRAVVRPADREPGGAGKVPLPAAYDAMSLIFD
jgi:hypothetical protein